MRGVKSLPASQLILLARLEISDLVSGMRLRTVWRQPCSPAAPWSAEIFRASSRDGLGEGSV